ncbi:MAG: hypothetical protein WB755_15670 [Terriglobales bacterium]
MKPHRVGNQIESWQSKLNLNLDLRRWTFRRQDKHSALPYVSAVANVVMFYAVGPAEQDGQDYLESAGGSPLYRMIHTALGMVGQSQRRQVRKTQILAYDSFGAKMIFCALL